jgi:hypothetical protein
MTTPLRETWDLRNAAAATLIKTEERMRRLCEAATAEDIVGLLEAFSPARSPGPEWTRSFEPLIEHLWTWCTEETLSKVEAEFRSRGRPWEAVANALAPEHGVRLRQQLRPYSAAARLPAFTLG